MSHVDIYYEGKPYKYKIFENDKGHNWSVSDTKLFPLITTNDVPTSAQLPPVKEETIDQDYFHAGAGELLWEHGKRCYNSPGCDTRTKSVVKLSPKITKATITGASTVTMPTLENGDFEHGATTHWTDLDSASNSRAHAGTWSGLETVGIGANEVFYQDLTWSNSLRNKIVTVNGWIYSNSPNGRGKIGVHDGVTETYGTLTAANATWVQISVTVQIGPAATQLRIECYSSDAGAGGISMYWDDITITPSGYAQSAVVDFCDFNGYPYAASGNMLLKWDGTDWDLVMGFPTTITSLGVWSNYLFIGQGYSYPYFYYDGTTFTMSTLTTGYMKYFALVGSTLWANSSDYEVKSSTNPINGGSWSTVTTIINNSKTITSMMDHPDTVFVAEQDGLYYLNSTGDVVSCLPDLYREAGTKSGRGMTMWKGNIYINGHYGSLYEYDYASNAITTITPSDTFPNQSAFTGFSMACDGDDEYLFVALDNGTKVQILAGRWETISDQINQTSTDFWWHHLIEQTLTDSSDNIRCMRMSTFPSARCLWLGCSNATDGIYYIDIDTNMGTAGDVLTSWHEGSEKHVLKTFYSLTLKTENLSATKTITPYFKKEFDTSWTALTAITSGSTNTVYFPADTTTKKIQLKFSFASDSATTSPHLLGYRLRDRVRVFDEASGRISIDDSGVFSAFGGMETNWEHTEFIGHDKNYYSVTAITEGLTTAKTLTLQYKIDGDTDYITHPEKFTISPVQTVYLPSETVGQIIKVKFTLSSPGDTTMPAYLINGELRPRRKRLFNFGLIIGNKSLTPGGGTIDRNAEKMAQILRDLNDKKWPFQIKTFYDKDFYIVIDDLKEQLLNSPENGRDSYVFAITAHEVAWEG